MRKLRINTLKIVLILVIAVLGIVAQPVFAQGGLDQLPGDRVIVFCQSTVVEVWGGTDIGTGVFLGSFFYGDLIASGSLNRSSQYGQVAVSVDLLGNFRAAWVGGPYYASGYGDFSKTFQCPGPFTVYTDLLRATNSGYGYPYGGAPYVAPSPYVTIPTVPVTYVIDPLTGIASTSTGIQQIAVINQSPGAVINQTVGISSPVSGCGARVYVVQAGDTLFRISRRFGTSVSALASCNAIANPTRIFVGQQIYVP